MSVLQVGRAGRFGTKGLAITFVSSEADSLVLNQVISDTCISVSHACQQSSISIQGHADPSLQ